MTHIQFLIVAASLGVLVASANPNDGVLANAQACGFRVLWEVPPPRPVYKGGGPFVRRPLAPGERLRFDIDHEGVLFGAMDDDTRLQVSMSMVDFGACRWRHGRWTEACAVPAGPG